LRAVQTATPEGNTPHWVGINTLQLRVDRIRLDQAIMLAALSGWLKVSGNPPTTATITSAGLALLEQNDGPTAPSAE
jgi:hypothetical protein